MILSALGTLEQPFAKVLEAVNQYNAALQKAEGGLLDNGLESGSKALRIILRADILDVYKAAALTRVENDVRGRVYAARQPRPAPLSGMGITQEEAQASFNSELDRMMRAQAAEEGDLDARLDIALEGGA